MNNNNESQMIFDKLASDARLVGASMVICANDDTKEYLNYGLSSVESNTKVSENTIFRIASISKTVGAIGLMQLLEKGKLSLDDDISDILGFKIRNPKYPDKKITVKMITTQTSSITDGYDDENPEYDNIRLGYNGVNGTDLDVSLQDLLLPSGKYYTPLTFSNYAPGENFIYSNFGCGIMACIIEKLSNMHYIDYMEQNVFKPLNIDASFRARNIKNQDLIADLYYGNTKTNSYDIAVSAKRFINGGYKDFKIGEGFRGPAGGLFISMKDLSKIMRLFMNRGEVDGVRLLAPATVEYMYQMQWFGNGENDGYRAKGIQMKILHNFEETPLRGHTGGAYGVRSYMFFDLDKKIGACFITNGGFYRKTENNILDIFDKSIQMFLNKYYSYTPSTLTFKIGEATSQVNDRTIIMPTALTKDSLLVPAISLADGLNIIPLKVGSNQIVFMKNKKESKQKACIISGTLMVKMNEVLNDLGISYTIDNNLVTIHY